MILHSRHSTSYRRSEVSAAIPSQSDALSVYSSGVFFLTACYQRYSFSLTLSSYLPVIACMHELHLHLHLFPTNSCISLSRG
jgi:hypothetical protein